MPLDTIFGMGERQRIMKNRRRTRLYGLVVAAGVILFGALLLGINILTSDEPVERVATPSSAPDPDEMARAAQQEASFMAGARQAAAEAEKQTEDKAPQASKPEEPQTAIPSDTTMYLTIPKMGLYDVLV